MQKTVFPNIVFEYNLVFVNIIFAIKTIFPDIVHYCCQMKWVYFIRFVSRPYRDAGLVVALSRHCEDSVLLYRVMQGRVPVGTNRLFSTILLSVYFTYFFWNLFRKSYDFFGIDSKKVVSLQGKK